VIILIGAMNKRRDNMNITQLEKEIIRVLKINENVDWGFF
jgi:hypothetical protein